MITSKEPIILSFFKSYRGLRAVYAISPLLFLLIVEGMSRLTNKAISKGNLQGIKMAMFLLITH